MAGFKSILIAPFSRYIRKQISKDSVHAVKDQQNIFSSLIQKAVRTKFGKDHNFEKIKTIADFQQSVPIRDYEGLSSYFELLKEGKSDILWPGKPKYFAKTSGTTSGIKYIPITNDSLSNHINTARNAILNHTALKKDASIFNGKLIFLSGSPTLSETGGIKTGRLSGIVNHEIPAWAKGNQLPSYQTNCIEEWEAKLQKIVQETAEADLRLISGIPPWVQMYFEQLLAYTGKSSIKEVFPNFQLFVYGGVNYEPYRNALEDLMGSSVSSLETYPASEGFFAFQDNLKNDGLLLNTNSGIFYEFVKLPEIHQAKPQRYTIENVELGVDYVMLVSSNAGLWAYNLGDTVQFVSKAPYKLVVSGRVSHFISAFGEHVIGKEVDTAMTESCKKLKIRVNEFTLAPMVNPPENALPYHEWLVEFEEEPIDLQKLAAEIDQKMTEQNIYYKDLIIGQILQPLRITVLKKGTFRRYMELQGKLGGQNKVPRLSNDRKIADSLLQIS